MKKKPEVGQTLYSLNIGNAARNREQVLTPVTVTTVGRKYFTVRPVGRTSEAFDVQFHLDTWREKTEYSVRHALYSTEQEWLDEMETKAIFAEMYQVFHYGSPPKLSLDQLRRIKAIVNEGKA